MSVPVLLASTVHAGFEQATGVGLWLGLESQSHWIIWFKVTIAPHTLRLISRMGNV